MVIRCFQVGSRHFQDMVIISHGECSAFLMRLPWALWRYGVISSLLHVKMEDKNQIRLLEELARNTWQKPDGRLVTLRPETILEWLYRYREGGLPGLTDRPQAGAHLVPDPISKSE